MMPNAHPRQEMLEFLPASAGSVLEIGCSSGAFAVELRRRYSSCYMVGLEPSETAAEVARDAFDEVVVGNFPDAKDKVTRAEGFDLIICNDVLEHMVEPAAALQSFRDMLSQKGRLVASIPNVRHVSALGPLLLQGDWHYKDSGVLDRTHLRFFTERTIRRFFAEAHWNILRIEGINRFVRTSDKRTRWWVKLAATCTGGRSNGFFFVQYAVVAQPS